MTDEHGSEAHSDLLAHVRSDPTSLDETVLVDAISDPSVPIEELTEALRIALRDDGIDANEAAATLVDVVSGEEYAKHPAAGRLLRVVGEERPDALSPYAEVVVRTATESDLASDEAAACLPALGAREPDTILPYLDNIGPLLDSEVPTIRHGAVGALVALSADHPSRVAAFVPALVDVVREGRTDLGESIGDPFTDRQMVPESLDRQLAAEHRRDSTIREGAALVLCSVADAEPEALLPAVRDLGRALETNADPHVRRHVLDGLELVADERPSAVIEVHKAAVAQLPETDVAADAVRGSAAALLTTLAETHGETIASTVRETEGAVAGLRETLDGDKPADRAAVASLLAALGRCDRQICADAADELETVARSDDDGETREAAASAVSHLRE